MSWWLRDESHAHLHSIMRLYREDLPLRFIRSRMLPIIIMKRLQYASHHTYRYTILVLLPL
jgi:hypothetical protein